MAYLVLGWIVYVCNLKLDTKMHVFYIPLPSPSERPGSSKSAPVCCVRVMTSYIPVNCNCTSNGYTSL